jgi:hypothetical protein
MQNGIQKFVRNLFLKKSALRITELPFLSSFIRVYFQVAVLYFFASGFFVAVIALLFCLFLFCRFFYHSQSKNLQFKPNWNIRPGMG